MTRLLMVLLIMVVSLPHAQAETKSIGLLRVVEGCEAIAVARLPDQKAFSHEGGTVELDLTRIIKGNLEPGKHRVSYDDYPSVNEDSADELPFHHRHKSGDAGDGNGGRRWMGGPA